MASEMCVRFGRGFPSDLYKLPFASLGWAVVYSLMSGIPHGCAPAETGWKRCGSRRQNMSEEIWGRVCNELLKTVGKSNFTTWIAPLRLNSVNAAIASFDAPTKFMCDWVSRNFADAIVREMRHAGLAVDRAEFRVTPATPRTSP